MPDLSVLYINERPLLGGTQQCVLQSRLITEVLFVSVKAWPIVSIQRNSNQNATPRICLSSPPIRSGVSLPPPHLCIQLFHCQFSVTQLIKNGQKS